MSCHIIGTLLAPWGVISLTTSHLPYQLGLSRPTLMMHKVRTASEHGAQSIFATASAGACAYIMRRLRSGCAHVPVFANLAQWFEAGLQERQGMIAVSNICQVDCAAYGHGSS